MSDPTERRIALAHLALGAQTWGDPLLPPLVALHGWLDNAGSFALLAPLLASRFHVLALDLPGHGHSDHLPAGATYHFIDYARAVLEAVQVMGLGSYTLLGHSLGAGVASLVAAAAPQPIDQLLLIEGLGSLGDDGTHTLQRFRSALVPAVTARRPLRLFRSVEQAIQARTSASGLRAELARPIVERGLQEVDGGWHWRSDPRLTQSSALRLAETQVRTLLHGIEAPTALLLAQPETPYLPGALIRERADCIGAIQISHMDGCHHLHLEHPQAVAEWINAAIQRHAR
ncbi:MAG: alpha/beta hydrolase [Rhodanobacter sp.]